MKKPHSFLLKIGLILVISLTLFFLNSLNYKYLAHDRIQQVITLQGADLSKARIVYDEYDYFEAGYVMKVYYDADPDIRYKYVYERDRRRVYVSASLGNATIDLTDRTGKYRNSFKTYFDYKGRVKEHD